MLLTFAVGFFPVFSIIWVYERMEFRRKIKSATFLSQQLDKLQRQSKSGTNLLLKTGSKAQDILIDSTDFLCAKANGNYCMVYYRKSVDVRHLLVRTTITALEKQTTSNPSIVRCHRSALVNLHHVDRLSGNARNYFLTIRGTDLKLDISRTVPDSIKRVLKNI